MDTSPTHGRPGSGGATGTSREEDLFDKMKRYMDSHFSGINENFRNTNEKIENISGTVATLSESVTRNQKDIAALRTDLKNMEKPTDLRKEIKEAVTAEREGTVEMIKKQVEIQVDRLKAIGEVAKLGPNGRATGEQPDRYWQARRTLRLWPIKGSSEQDLWNNTRDFIFDMLMVDQNAIRKEDIISVRRVIRAARPAGRRRNGHNPPQVWDEVSVSFASVQDRDMIWSHAHNLANQVNDEGKPLAGVRLEIPDALNGVFRDLQWYGHHLRGTHGPGLKRQIKFDDTDKTLYMDVKLPDADEWLYVDHQLAKENRVPPKERTTAFSRNRLTSSQSSCPSDVDPSETGTRPQPESLPKSATLQKYGGGNDRGGRGTWR